MSISPENPVSKPKRAGRPKSKSRGATKGLTKAEQRANSLEQILDATEKLFSSHGLYGVTLKDVAKEVGVHTSLLHYYFEDKQDLFDQVVMRRAPETNQKRMDAMVKYEQEAGESLTVEGALKAFLDTDLETYISGGEGWRNYGALAGQVNNAPVWGSETMSLFDPTALKLIDLLKKAMPDTAEEDIFWGYQFVTGALTHTLARTGRIDRLSGGLCRSDDFDAVKERMASFMAGGFLAICKERDDARSVQTDQE